MDLLELAIGLIEKGGAVAGLGGGYVATRVLGKISEGLKDAKAARDTAAAALKRSNETHELVDKVRVELQALYVEIERIKRGSFTTEGHDSRTGERLAQLETRMSSVEDDLDESVKENKRSWEQIQRSVGRIEGSLRPNRDD